MAGHTVEPADTTALNAAVFVPAPCPGFAGGAGMPPQWIPRAPNRLMGRRRPKDNQDKPISTV
jgi:hypothetical protein